VLGRRQFILLGAASATRADALDTVVQQYVKLVLSVGLHDSEYVDSYYGPPEWKATVERAKPSLVELERRAASLA
jgi:hypothetical protein